MLIWTLFLSVKKNYTWTIIVSSSMKTIIYKKKYFSKWWNLKVRKYLASNISFPWVSRNSMEATRIDFSCPFLEILYLEGSDGLLDKSVRQLSRYHFEAKPTPWLKLSLQRLYIFKQSHQEFLCRDFLHWRKHHLSNQLEGFFQHSSTSLSSPPSVGATPSPTPSKPSPRAHLHCCSH